MDPITGEVAATDKAQATQDIEEEKIEKSPRLKAIEEIARRHEASRQEDQKALKFDILTDDGEIIPADETEAVEEAIEAEKPEEPEEIKAEEPAEEMREVVVDGKRMQIPLSKILDAGVRTFQKETAADMRLAAASELERQARERFQTAPPVQDAQQPSPSDEDASLARAIQFGTEEEAKTAIAKLRNASVATNPQELRQFVNGALTNDIPQHLAFYEATRWVRGEYKEIFADPDLSQFFMGKEQMARQSGDQRPFVDLYKDIAEGMSHKFNLRKATKETEKAQSTERVIRKAQAPRVATAAGGRQAAPQERKVQTVTDYVQRQRELRGLAPLPRNQQGI